MGLRSFLEELRESGRVRVAAPNAPDDDDTGAVSEILRELDREVRSDLAFQAPAYHAAAAEWAARSLYRAGQLFVFREPDDAMRRALSVPCPGDHSASVIYSVDLTFSVLPDLVTLVRSATGIEAFLAELLNLSRAWPLSAVGIVGVGAVDIDGFVDDPCLRQLYVDRIIARRDLTRVAHPAVRVAIERTIGLFPDLAPAVAAAIRSQEIS